MKYLLMTIRALWKMLLGSLLVFAVTAAWICYDISQGVRVFAPLWVLLGAGLLLNILLIVFVASEMKREAPLNEILAESGLCDAYVEKYREVYPNPTTAKKLRLIGILTTVKRYDEAEQMLAEISPAALGEDLRIEYHTCRMDLLLSTHRMREAIAELQSCRRFMDDYANAHPRRGIVYGLNAGVILAAANDYESSEHYLQIAEYQIAQQKSISPCIAQIARVMQLYLLGFSDQAQQRAEQTRLAIAEDSILKAGWQKQHFLEKLDDAKTYEGVVP